MCSGASLVIWLFKSRFWYFKLGQIFWIFFIAQMFNGCRWLTLNCIWTVTGWDFFLILTILRLSPIVHSCLENMFQSLIFNWILYDCRVHKRTLKVKKYDVYPSWCIFRQFQIKHAFLYAFQRHFFLFKHIVIIKFLPITPDALDDLWPSWSFRHSVLNNILFSVSN